MIVKSPGPNAPATTGRTVVMTSYAVSTLPPEQIEAVLAHELNHHIGLHAVPVFCHTLLTLPIRALWWLLARIWRPVRRIWQVAVRWHTPFGFLVTFLLAIAVAAVFVVSVIPAGIAFIGAALSRFSIEQSEFLADEAVGDVGLGPQLLAALEAAIEVGHIGTDRVARLLSMQPLIVRRAQRLRKNLAL
jgi:Zn-dependent protease with chaperone function